VVTIKTPGNLQTAHSKNLSHTACKWWTVNNLSRVPSMFRQGTNS
jgi:hypothetical protein